MHMFQMKMNAKKKNSKKGSLPVDVLWTGIGVMDHIKEALRMHRVISWIIAVIAIAILIISIGITLSPTGKKYIFENSKAVRIMRLKEPKQLDEINNALKAVGLKADYVVDWKSCDTIDSDGRTYYCFSFDGKDYDYGVWLNPDSSVHTVLYSGITLFKDGTVIDKIGANIPSKREIMYMQTQAEEIVKQHLQSPDTAKFSNFKFRKVHGVGDVFGVVDSQNDLGALVHNLFSASFDFNNNGVLTRLEIDGDIMKE